MKPLRQRLKPGSLFRAVSLLGVALFVVGCGSKGIVHTPAKLVDISHPLVQPQQVWSRSIGNGSGGFYPAFRIAAEKDAVFVAAEDGDVAAYNSATGATIWSTDTDARLISGPTVNGDAVLLGSLDAKVITLKRADGKPLWKGDASSEVMSPPVSDGRVVVVRGVDGRIFGLDADSGRRLWNFDRSEPSLTLRGQSAPLFEGDNVLIGLDTGELISLNSEDGKLAWAQSLSVPSGRSELDRLVDIDADLLPSTMGVFVVSYGGDIALVDPVSGEPRWKRRVKSYSGMALSSDGRTLYVTDDDGYVWALDASNGAEEWKQKALKYRRLSPPAYFDGYVVVGDYDGYLHWLEPSDGKIVGRTRLGSDPIIAAPVVANGLLYVMDSDGDLAAYKDAPVS